MKLIILKKLPSASFVRHLARGLKPIPVCAGTRRGNAALSRGAGDHGWARATAAGGPRSVLL